MKLSKRKSSDSQPQNQKKIKSLIENEILKNFQQLSSNPDNFLL